MEKDSLQITEINDHRLAAFTGQMVFEPLCRPVKEYNDPQGGAPMFRTLLLAIGPVILTAQTPPSFEVASVKPIVGPVPNHPVGLRIHHGTLNVDDGQLRQIIGLAYGIQRVKVQGGPDWLDQDKYIIVVKAENADATPEQIKAMLQTLLAERFKLGVHRETKDLNVYTLVVGKNGSKLQEATEEQKSCSSVTGTNRGLQMVYQ